MISKERSVLVKNLKASYGGVPVLNNINLILSRGQSAIILGPSGSGKTTLLLSMTGVLSHLLNGKTEGIINIEELNPLSIEEYLRLPLKVGVILQDPEKQIAMPTPRDELVFTLENFGYSSTEALIKSEQILSRLGLYEKSSYHVENLSGGEKRRLTIASSIIHDPPVILMDEPSASIDPWGIAEIRALINEQKKMGKTIVLIEHKPVFFRDLFEETYILDNGELKNFSESSTDKIQDIEMKPKPCLDSRNKEDNRAELFRLSDVDIGYNKKLIHIDELAVRRGEIIVLVGPNGSGKTTLLKTLAGFIKPISGKIDNKHIKKYYVPQFPDLSFIKRTVREELADASQRSGIYKKLQDLFPWYASKSDFNPFKLSHGQRRWLSILIAYGYNPDLILLDEPSTGLDSKMYDQLVNLVKELKGSNKGIIISSHDPRILNDLATKVLYIENGSLVEKDKCKAYEELYRIAGVKF